MNEPLGFEVNDRYVVDVQFEKNFTEDSTAFFSQLNQLKRGLKSVSPIKAVSVSNGVYPYGNSEWRTGSDTDGFSYNTSYAINDEEALESYHLKLVKGRFYTKEDYVIRKMPLVVNQKFVDMYMKGKEPLGFEFSFNREDALLVGVIEGLKYYGDFRKEEPFAFSPANYAWGNSSALIIAVQSDTPATIQKEIHTILKRELKHENFSITALGDRKKSFNNRYWVPLIGMLSVTLFLIINIAMGLFGTLRYAINKRRSEIGLRKVLGATSNNIRLQVVGEVVLLMMLAFMVALIPTVQIFEFGNLIEDYTTFITSIVLSLLLILILVLICSIIPSHRASKLMPAVALHEE